MTSSAGATDAFRRQRWTGGLASLVGGPIGLAMLIGGIADGVPAVMVEGLGLLVSAAIGTRIIRGGVVLELDDNGFTDRRSGVYLAWDEVERIQPRVRW